LNIIKTKYVYSDVLDIDSPIKSIQPLINGCILISTEKGYLYKIKVDGNKLHQEVLLKSTYDLPTLQSLDGRTFAVSQYRRDVIIFTDSNDEAFKKEVYISTNEMYQTLTSVTSNGTFLITSCFRYSDEKDVMQTVIDVILCKNQQFQKLQNYVYDGYCDIHCSGDNLLVFDRERHIVYCSKLVDILKIDLIISQVLSIPTDIEIINFVGVNDNVFCFTDNEKIFVFKIQKLNKSVHLEITNIIDTIYNFTMSITQCNNSIALAGNTSVFMLPTIENETTLLLTKSADFATIVYTSNNQHLVTIVDDELELYLIKSVI